MKYNEKELKQITQALLKLSQEETDLLNNTKINLYSKNRMDKKFQDRYLGFPVLAEASFNKKRIPEISSRNEYPIFPDFNYRTLKEFENRGYITEPEIMSHELGHVKDLISAGETSEPSAIAFEREILRRSDRTPKIRRSLANIVGLNGRPRSLFDGRYFAEPSFTLNYEGLGRISG